MRRRTCTVLPRGTCYLPEKKGLGNEHRFVIPPCGPRWLSSFAWSVDARLKHHRVWAALGNTRWPYIKLMLSLGGPFDPRYNHSAYSGAG